MAGVNSFAGKRGFVVNGNPAEFGTCQGLPHSATAGTDTTPSTTETYIAEVVIPNNCDLTGIALLNGSAATGNVKLGLYDSNGYLLAQTASTAQSGTAAFQKVPFTSVYQVRKIGTYFIAAQFSSTSARFRSHALGLAGASKVTGTTFGTLPGTITAPSTFTADVGAIASTY